MQSTNTVLYSLPATSNLLDKRTRKQLVRSARKVGEIFGTTPQVADAERPIPISVLPIGVASSASSVRSATPDSIKKSRRHASICETPSQVPHLIYTSSSASSSVTSLALSTHSSHSGMSSESQYHMEKYLEKESSSFKKKSSKRKGPAELSRPLVLRLKAVPAHNPASQPSTPSPTSLLTPGTATPTGSSPSNTPTTPVFPSATETRRKRMAKLTRTLGEIIPPHLVSASPKSREDGDSLSPITPKTSSSAPKHRSRSMSVDYSAQDSRSSEVWTVVGQTWQGEWNMKDIRDVQKGLRALRAW